MKTLLLTSSFQQVADQLAKILPKPANEMTVVFVPTAADPYGEDKPWFYADRNKLIEMGFKIVDLSLKDKSKEQVAEVLKQADIIFVAGGNTFYLLDHARKSGFAELVPKLVEQGIIYVGSSAGSYLACPTIEASTWKNQDKNSIGLTDLKALSLVDFIVFAHYDPKHNELLAEELPRASHAVRILNDRQAILVTGDNAQLVGEQPEITLKQ